MSDDFDVPGLDGVKNDTDDPEKAAEILDGLLGDASDHDDVPTKAELLEPDPDEEVDDDDREQPEPSVEGRWACRFCQTERRNSDTLSWHFDGCSEYQRHLKIQEHQAETDPSDDPEVPENPTPQNLADPSESPGEQHSFLVDTQWHEFRAFLKFTEHGLAPYYALHRLMRNENWHDGKPSRQFEYDGRTYTVEFSFQQTENEDKRIKPWDDPEFKIERPREFRLELKGPGDLRKASFHIKPRWPDIQLQDGTSIQNPREIVGVDVDAEGSNHDPGDYPELLDNAMQAFGVNGGSEYSRKRYLAPPHVEPWSNIIDGELYVRIHEDYSGRIIGLKGPLERMSYLLSGDRSGYRKRVADDLKHEGYYHTTTLGSIRCRRLLAGHQLGKEVKHYHVKNRENLDEDDPLRQPKVGVSLQNRISDTTVYWNRQALENDRRADESAIGLPDMERELDEILLNVLRWADIPTRPDHQVFVEDSVFKPDLNRRDRTLVPDPLPVIENESEHMVTRALNKMVDIDRSDTDAQVIQQVLADGGPSSPKGLARKTGKNYGTILTSLDRLSDVIDHTYGKVEIKSHYIAEQLAERAGRLLEDFGRVKQGIDEVGKQIAGVVDGLGMDDSPFEMWAKTHLKAIDDPDDDPRLILRFGTVFENARELRNALREGRSALIQTIGEDAAASCRLARWGKATARLSDGTPVHQANALG